jgi:TolB protein
MNPDGGGVTKLTNQGSNFDGAWSPDGNEIAFVSTRFSAAGYSSIYVMNADGSGVTRLTYGNSCYESPSWSKDGKRIAFASTLGGDPTDCGYPNDIYVMNADGGSSTVVRPERSCPGEAAMSL